MSPIFFFFLYCPRKVAAFFSISIGIRKCFTPPPEIKKNLGKFVKYTSVVMLVINLENYPQSSSNDKMYFSQYFQESHQLLYRLFRAGPKMEDRYPKWIHLLRGDSIADGIKTWFRSTFNGSQFWVASR